VYEARTSSPLSAPSARWSKLSVALTFLHPFGESAPTTLDRCVSAGRLPPVASTFPSIGGNVTAFVEGAVSRVLPVAFVRSWTLIWVVLSGAVQSPATMRVLLAGRTGVQPR
jgi:hypothetical protein